MIKIKVDGDHCKTEINGSLPVILGNLTSAAISIIRSLAKKSDMPTDALVAMYITGLLHFAHPEESKSDKVSSDDIRLLDMLLHRR